MRHLLLRPVIFVSLVLGLFIFGELVVIGGLTWRNHQRLNVLKNDISNGHRLEEAIFVLLNNQLQQNDRVGKDSAQNKRQNLLPIEYIDDAEMLTDVRRLQEAFAKAERGDNESLLNTLDTTRQLFLRHTRKEENLLGKIAEDSQLEFKLAVVLPLLTFGIIILVGRHFFKRHMLAPLDSLKELLQLLARGDRHPIQQAAADPLIQDLFNNYNQLVIRLTELEQEHLNYTTELEYKIRATTSELLEQSQQIARSERLSVVAELAASTAHELRNPLAGIQLALDNILQECRDDELSERLNAVNDEVKRLTQHLNDLLALTRTSPKLPEPLEIERVCNELKQFLKYQIPENIDLIYEIEPKLITCIPENEFRLALLNLLLNAIHAVGKEPGLIKLVAKKQSDRIFVTVQDSGPGFAETMLNNGIRPFVSLKEKGTGLGLAMVQRFIKSQQGTIRLNNSEGHACVTLTLPVLKI